MNVNSSTTTFMYMASPVGRLLLVEEDGALAGVFYDIHRGQPPNIHPEWMEDRTRFTEITRQLSQYFEGKRETFELDLVLDGTAFQQCVWSALREIPYGTTISYGQLAKRVGSPNAARAVGHANALNPLSIVVPCHRVVGADGSLTGYAGGEASKAQLLDLERNRAS